MDISSRKEDSAESNGSPTVPQNHLHTLIRRKWLVLGVTALISVTTLVVIWAMPEVYRVEDMPGVLNESAEVLGRDHSNAGPEMSPARLIPNGKVDVYDESGKIGELNSEVPVPAGKILTSDQPFIVTMAGVRLAAKENTRISVNGDSHGTDIFVEKGQVYFALDDVKDKTLTLRTPQEKLTVQSVQKDESESDSTKGYLQFENNQTEVGVIEGGKLEVADAGGLQVIESGNRLQVLDTPVDMAASEAGAAPAAGNGSKELVIGGITVGGGVGGWALVEGLDDNSDDGVIMLSPFLP